MADFIPSAENPLLAWSANFKTQLALVSSTLNLSAQMVTDWNAKCDQILAAINDATLAKNAYKMKLDAKNLAIGDAQQVLHNAAAFIKASPGYSAGIGQSLGIISIPKSPTDLATFKPNVIVTGKKGQVVIKFTKKGVEGVNVYARLQGESNWVFLARDTHSPYDDYRPLAKEGTPEVREYKLVGVFDDIEIGVASDIASITFAG